MQFGETMRRALARPFHLKAAPAGEPAAIAKDGKASARGDSYARIGELEVRLARGRREIRKAQRLRYKVFFEEGGARPDAKARLTRRDGDKYDRFCDHLIVVDHSAVNRRGKRKPKIIGAYRLLRSDQARKAGGFYSQGEYDLDALLERHRDANLLELGRACVASSHRNTRAIELLWRGLLAYMRRHRIEAMFGCASFPGGNAFAHAQALTWLARNAASDAQWPARARESLRIDMEMLSPEALDERRALAGLPPLVRAYLRVGARFGDGAVVDRKFNTTDVFVILPAKAMGARYVGFFSSDAPARASA